MPNFEDKPHSRDDFDKNSEDAESLKKQMAGAKTADEMMAIATKMKAVEENENELMGNAREEASKEDEERKAYGEAVVEDVERKMYDEAKTEDAERTTAKKTEKMDADLENLKSQIVGAKNADEMMKIAEKIKEIEEKKKEIGAGSQKEESEKRGKELEELKLKDETESAAKVGEILKKMNGKENLENQEVFSPEIQKYIDKMPVKDGMYMGNYLSSCPQELMGNEKFLLKIAEVNPASAYSHASDELKHNKEFIINLMKSQPSAETDKVNYSQVDFYEIERLTPELLYDKDLVMTLIGRNDEGRGRLGSIRTEQLKDKEVYEAVIQKAVANLVKEAEDFVKRKSTGGYAYVDDFKVRDGSTIGGERWSLNNDKDFVKKATEAVSGIVNVSMRNGEMYFEPKV